MEELHIYAEATPHIEKQVTGIRKSPYLYVIREGFFFAHEYILLKWSG